MAGRLREPGKIYEASKEKMRQGAKEERGAAFLNPISLLMP